MSSSAHYTNELPGTIPPPTSVSPPPTIHSPQPISAVTSQPYPSYTYPSGPSDYYAPPAQDTMPGNTGYQSYTPVPIQSPAPGAVAPPVAQPYVQPSYDAEKGDAAMSGKKMYTIFGKKYTKKTVIIACVVIAVVLIFIIGLGAGLGAKNSHKKKSIRKTLGGGGGSDDYEYDYDDGTDGGYSGEEDLDQDYNSGSGDSDSTDGECNSCSCYTDFALLQKCVQNEHDMKMDILNNWKQ